MLQRRQFPKTLQNMDLNPWPTASSPFSSFIPSVLIGLPARSEVCGCDTRVDSDMSVVLVLFGVPGPGRRPGLPLSCESRVTISCRAFRQQSRRQELKFRHAQLITVLFVTASAHPKPLPGSH